MNNQELFNLFKHSKLAQVAKPLQKPLRGKGSVPTHQIVYTPKSSAIRSSFGIKTSLPKQIGFSHIVFNDIDNPKNMPDVEKYSGPHYNRLKFQESGLVLKNYYSEKNPLFPSDSTKISANLKSLVDSVIAELNLNNESTPEDVRQILKRNPDLYEKFQKWLTKNSPESYMTNMPSKLKKLAREFLSSEAVSKKEFSLSDIANKGGSKIRIQGTGGFSYNQRGRLANSPNGIKNGVIMPGRMVGDREAAIGGFIANVNDRTTMLQYNYSKNFPGKHSRQFVMPFKVNDAEITDNGRVKLYADGVKVGSWMLKGYNPDASEVTYEASNPNFESAGERNRKDNVPLESLLNLISNSKK